MMFRRVSDVVKDESTDRVQAAINYMLLGIDAVDTERRLSLETTNGRTRNARRWFVFQFDPDTFEQSYDKRVVFRAWTLAEAIEKANTDTRTVNRINAVFGEES